VSIKEKFSEAIVLARQKELNVIQLFTLTAEFEAAQSRGLAITLFETWVQHNKNEYSQAVYFNLGAMLSNDGDLEGAKLAYQEAIRIAPAFVQPRVNLGLTYERLKRPDLAILEWKAVEYNIPIDAENKSLVLAAINHLGRLFESTKQFYDALITLTKSLQIEPDQPDAIHHWVSLRQKLCFWPIFDPTVGIPEKDLLDATSALAMISVTDDPQIQLNAAHNFIRKKINVDVAPLTTRKGYKHKKIRIGYCSSDFCLHPVSMLTVELFELHNRDQFEIYGYCWSPEDGSELRQRVIKSMDHFERIDKLGDDAAARLIRSHEIDILIDLQGQTAGARANMLAYRPAPVQITYLGLPATTGFPFIDYVIADRYIIPENMTAYYSEKPLYMPDIYQVSDRKRDIGPIPTRANLGLPEKGFIFSSFNNSLKYTPEMFDVWMRILHQVPDSVLWLLSDNKWAEKNLRREAQSRGITSDRIIFGYRVAPQDYLARYAVADLFLDTFPFNAGTTANDALWMGLPVLTYSGKCFSSRMAGALLLAAGLPELITTKLADYEKRAVELARNPGICQGYRDHLKRIHDTGVVFDTALFVKNLEQELQKIAIK
jgi:predicted O-linked N-acetylglucosamine transferase (SPINDLY family)